MNEDTKNIIINKLKDLSVKNPCCRCNGINFEIVDKTDIILSNKKIMPSCVVACSNCGNITLHSLGVILENYNNDSF